MVADGGEEMYMNRHPQWGIALNCVNKIVKLHGDAIVDYRCGKIWDAGQSICAEAYGPKWYEDPVFLEWNRKPDTEPPEPHYFECAVRMANGYIPEWMQDDGETDGEAET